MTREDILKLANHQGLFDYFDLEGDSVGQLMLYTLVLDCMATEREACAKVCDLETALWEENSDGQVSLRSVAAVIRARGNT
jgi:Fe-S-cluster-containing dehydrogenase component